MGRINDKLIEYAELIEKLYKAGADSEDIDAYMKEELSPQEFKFFISNKNEIMSSVKYLNDGDFLMSSLDEACGCGKRRPTPLVTRRSKPSVKTASKPVARKPLPKRKG